MGGFTRGLQLIAGFLKILLLAAGRSNSEAMLDALGVARIWVGETVDEAGAVRVNVWALLAGADPWRDSRSAYRELDQKWRGRL